MKNYVNALAFAGVSSAVLLLSLPSPVTAEEITPSHVFQSTDNIISELSSMHEANFSTPEKSRLKLTPRRPRHVFQKAREVYLKVQRLKEAKGESAVSLKPFPVRAVKPHDVKELVDNSLSDLQKLRGKFGSKKPEAVAMPKGKTPTDVYMNLSHAGAYIDSLGIPKTVPNDVYQLAQTIIGDLKTIRAKKGITSEINEPPAASGKKPSDVYLESLALLEKLKKLTDNPDYAIPGGVVLLKKVSGRITPGIVLDALNNSLAEVGAIKQVSGVSDPTVIAPKQSGKTPSDVYMAVKKAQAIVDTLIQ